MLTRRMIANPPRPYLRSNSSQFCFTKSQASSRPFRLPASATTSSTVSWERTSSDSERCSTSCKQLRTLEARERAQQPHALLVEVGILLKPPQRLVGGLVTLLGGQPVHQATQVGVKRRWARLRYPSKRLRASASTVGLP